MTMMKKPLEEPDSKGNLIFIWVTHAVVWFLYRELLEMTCRLANTLKSHGVRKGDRVAIYMSMCPTAVAAMLACARIGAVHTVVFAGFSSDALAGRIQDAECKVVITCNQGVRGGRVSHLKATVDMAVKSCPSVKSVLVAQRTNHSVPMGELDTPLEEAMARESCVCPPEPMDSEDMLFLLYTSGSTGKPKGIIHTQAGYLLYTSLTHQYVFDYCPGDVFGCVADIGWITGHSYVVYGPLANGGTTVLFESTPVYPDPGRYWEMVQRLRINQIYAAPTALRLLLKYEDSWVKKYDRSSLRTLGSVGEPINHEAWDWFYNVVGEGRCPLVDTWWQTETGGVCIAPRPAEPGAEIRPAMAMRPFFGIQPALMDEVVKMNSAIVVFLNDVEKVRKLTQNGIVGNNETILVSPLSSPDKKVMLCNVPPFISDEAIGKELSQYGRMVSHIKKIPLGCKSPLTLSVLNVVKLDILLRPALRGRVTPVFLSDRGGTRAELAGVFPPAAAVRAATEGPGAAAAPDLTGSEPQAQSAAQKPTGATPAPEKPAKPDQKKLWSTEKSSVGSGAACADRGRHGGAGQPHGNTGHYTSAGGRGRRGHESGDLLSEPTEIHKQKVSFYSKLYSSEWSGAQVVEDSFLMDLPKLSERAARELDRELTLEELHEALQRMENGWASGIDGLPGEFYKAFCAVIGQDVLDVLQDSIRRGELPLSCRRAILTLLLKKGDLTHLKNWRPVSLLCTDCKLLSKALASRLTKGQVLTGNDVSGALCIGQPWPGMARSIYGDHQRFVDAYFKPYPGYYFTGDGAYRTADGHYQITGRMDDIINVSGHRLGTAEIEDALDEHPDVPETAVIGISHDVKGEVPFAFVVMKENVSENQETVVKELRQLVATKIAKYAVPDHFLVPPSGPTGNLAHRNSTTVRLPTHQPIPIPISLEGLWWGKWGKQVGEARSKAGQVGGARGKAGRPEGPKRRPQPSRRAERRPPPSSRAERRPPTRNRAERRPQPGWAESPRREGGRDPGAADNLLPRREVRRRPPRRTGSGVTSPMGTEAERVPAKKKKKGKKNQAGNLLLRREVMRHPPRRNGGGATSPTGTEAERVPEKKKKNQAGNLLRRREVRRRPPRRNGGGAMSPTGTEAERVVKRLPKTRSGKIMRRILRKVVMGELDSLGDVSTLDDPSVVNEIIEAHQRYRNQAARV
ncbi:hypothetical protein QTP70_029817 [Hemibagrus guttatus]|uniref:acetate--CoA ligase n=1 Tax=Hemibagrus guttatus TaxID=175788 RepID=A0AAE0V3C7_9TELE|nr:hypothetical protein QTP70_029817 [Hemibagrus guttatus]